MDKLLSWMEHTLHQLNLVSDMNQIDGFSRLGYTKEEQKSQHQFRVIAQELGLETNQDFAGNQWAIWKVDEKAPTIALGSHLDTVYHGGGYDGVAGVLAGLATLKALKDEGFQPNKNIAIIAFACEESARFGVSTIGSQAICGILKEKHIGHLQDLDGITLSEAVENCGLKWEEINQAKIPRGDLEQFIELHIEQGKQLESTNTKIGIVSAIARPTRLKIMCKGMTNHTGTTRMEERRDALVAIAPLIHFVEKKAIEINKRQEGSIVATVSKLELNPNSMSMIPGEVIIGIDIRSTSAALKKEMTTSIYEFLEDIKRKRSVYIHVEKIVDDNPIQLDAFIQKRLHPTCSELGFSSMFLDSGAGHDVMNMAQKWPSGLIFIPCRDGISHHPNEYAEMKYLLVGTKLLINYLKELVVTK